MSELVVGWMGEGGREGGRKEGREGGRKRGKKERREHKGGSEGDMRRRRLTILIMLLRKTPTRDKGEDKRENEGAGGGR